jgi:hypothetical protein
MKAAEGSWASLRYNDCGSRSAHPCAERAKEGYRLVVLGTSISHGYAVEYEDMFAPKLEEVLSRFCRGEVDVQNVGFLWPTAPSDPRWNTIDQRVQQALGLRPDLLVVFVSPWDLYGYNEQAPTRVFADQATQYGGSMFMGMFNVLSGVARYLRALREESRFVLAARHFLYRNDQYFLDEYLNQGDASDYLRTPVSRAWQLRLKMFEKFVGHVGGAATRANVSLAVVYTPTEPQVLLARNSGQKPKTDSQALQQRLGGIAESHGWKFIDTLSAFVGAPVITPLLYRVNGHPNGSGHSMIANAMGTFFTSEHHLLSCR